MSLSLIVMRVLADHAQAGVSGPVGVPLGLAFGAGVLSTLNPCGFALLPAYVSYAVEQQVETASERQPSGWLHLLRGGLLGLPLAAGFLLVFLVAGGVLALDGRLLVHLFPWLAILVGTGLALLGGWTLFTRRAPEIPGLGTVAAKLSPSRPGGSATSEALGDASGLAVLDRRRPLHRSLPAASRAMVGGRAYGDTADEAATCSTPCRTSRSRRAHPRTESQPTPHPMHLPGDFLEEGA